MERPELDRPIVWLIIGDGRVRSLIQAQLSEDGFEVRSSVSWTDALFRIERQPRPPLAAIGVDVADSTADDILARRMAALADLAPVVALTGSFGPAAARLLGMGATVVLQRPITVGEVCRVVRHLAESAPVRA
jgi:DNA-binding NtrC family response regulator